MPTTIGDRIATAIRDNKVSNKEVRQLIDLAKKEPWTPELKAEVEGFLRRHGDKFSSVARGTLSSFLATQPATAGPTTPTGPAAPARTDLSDPRVLDKHATSVSWTPVSSTGQLYVDGIHYDDVVQGSIGDCYMVAAFSSLAHANPELIRNAITDNGDGTYDVRFFERSWSGFRPVTVKVDGDIPTENGRVKYGKSRDSAEQWVTLLEKAFAQWKGGYEAVGNGGRAGDVFQALTGRSSWWTSTGRGQDAVFTSMTRALSAGKPVTAGTFGKDSGVSYDGTGVYAWHAYTVLGTSEEGGQKYVRLRNPWGSHEPGSDGKNDGIFTMKLSDFVTLYDSAYLGG